MSKKGKFLLGAGVGLGLGLLISPKSGEENWNTLKLKCNDLLKKLKSLDKEEVKDNITEKLTELQNGLKDLNKEKVASYAKEKGEALKQKADELYHLALEKGSPVVEKAAKEVKEATIKVLKNVTAKLEEDNKPKKKVETKKASK